MARTLFNQTGICLTCYCNSLFLICSYIDPNNNAATEAIFQPIQVKFVDGEWQSLKTMNSAGNLKQEVTDDII